MNLFPKYAFRHKYDQAEEHMKRRREEPEEDTKIEDTPCPACGAPEKAFLTDRGTLGHLSRCRCCGYTWTLREGS